MDPNSGRDPWQRIGILVPLVCYSSQEGLVAQFATALPSSLAKCTFSGGAIDLVVASANLVPQGAGQKAVVLFQVHIELQFLCQGRLVRRTFHHVLLYVK